MEHVTPIIKILVRLSYIAIVLLLVWGYLRYFEWRNLYYPQKGMTETPEQYGLTYTDEYFLTEDGLTLHGWWIPHEQATGTIIYCHGNAGNISGRAWMLEHLHRMGVNIFIFDYRGYGLSKGIPTEKGTYKDAHAAYEVVRSKYADSDAPPVIVMGRSLGGAIALQLAIDKPTKGLILEHTFTSTMDMGKHLFPFLPVKQMIHFHYDSISKIKDLHIPKLISHSRADETIPFSFGEQLYQQAAEEKQFIETVGGHNEVQWCYDTNYWNQIKQFVDECLN